MNFFSSFALVFAGSVLVAVGEGRPQMGDAPRPESVRMLTQAELDSLRVQSGEISKRLEPAPPVPPFPEEKPVSFYGEMRILAFNGYWAAVPKMAFLHAPEKLSSKFSSDEVETKKVPKPVFVTKFPGPFYTFVRLVEVKRDGAGYFVDAKVLEQMKKFDDSFVVAVEKGIPVRMPVVVR
jgi:hypothetical protein